MNTKGGQSMRVGRSNANTNNNVESGGKASAKQVVLQTDKMRARRRGAKQKLYMKVRIMQRS